ncbi:MAG: hypothetical protein P8179_18195 [Candidatus Thiodiazotropha sp.]
MEPLQAFKYKLRPNGEQARAMRRFVFNKALAVFERRRNRRSLGWRGCQWFCAWIMVLWIPLQSHAMQIPPGWKQHFDHQKQTQTFQPTDNRSSFLIKYYPKVLLEQLENSDWLKNKLSTSKAPYGEWMSQANVVRDYANYAHGSRKFRLQDGTTGVLIAVAVTIDRMYTRLAVAIFRDNGIDKNYRDQAISILKNIYKVEKADALAEDRGTDIEANPPDIKGIKKGGPIKFGRYVGAKTRSQEVMGRYEVVLYETGEYEFLRGYSKSGYYTYSQSTGRLDLTEDFYNSTYHPDDEFCLYGIDEKTGTPVIYAEDDYERYRLNWVNPVNTLSPQQNEKLKAMKKAREEAYPYVTNPGNGVSTEQIETILYTYVDNYIGGGFEVDEEIYLLMKDGRVMDGIPIAPNRLDVAKSRSREPNRWGWWKYEDGRYSFAWNIDRKNFVVPKGKQMKGLPIPADTRLDGEWGASTSFTSLDFSSTSFWGVYLDKSGRFTKYHNSMMQAGGEMQTHTPTPMVSTYSDDEGSVTSVIGSNIGGGTSTKNNRPNSDRVGSYSFDGYNLTLKFDNGVEEYLVAFTTDDEFNGIWFESGRLYRK